MINSVCLVGNLAADPEIRIIPSGKKVAKFRMGVNEYWTNRQTGARNERTHWFSLNAWDRMADICENYLRKGIKIAVRGSLEYSEWTSNDGSKRSKIEIRVREMEILTPKSSSNSEYSRNYTARPEPITDFQHQQQANRGPSSAFGNNSQSDSDNTSDFPPVGDDDIPF